MPSVGTRRSTRVFLPKSKVGDGCGVDSGSVVLRSGKRFFSGYGRRVVEDKPKVTPRCCDKSPVFCRGNGWGVPVEVDKCQSEKKGTDAVEVEMVSPCRRFGVVYGRKRKRLDSDGHCSRSDDDGEYSRFRIAFVRKRRTNGLSTREERPIFRPKVSIWKTGVLLGRHEIAEASRGFALKVGILDTDIWSGSGGRWVFLVLIDTSDCTNILHFSCFLSSTLVAMRRKRVKMVQVASFLLSRALSDVFSKHGVHFLPVNLDSYISCRNAIRHAGFCGINGSHKSVPLLSLNFSALPFYFKSLYLSKILDPVRFVSLLGHIRVPWQDCRRVDMSKLENIAPKCTEKSKTPPMERCEFLNEKTHNEFCDREKSNLPSIVLAVESPYFLQESMLAFQNRKANALRVCKYQQKRTALRSARVTTPFGGERFHESTIDTLDFVVAKADFTVKKLQNFSVSLAAARKIRVREFFLSQEDLRKIDELELEVKDSASELSTRADSNSKDIQNLLDLVRLVLIILGAVTTLLVFLGLAFSILGLHLVVKILAIIGWILVTAAFLLGGVFLILNNVVGDTCVAMDDWVANPQANTALDEILPCVDSETAKKHWIKARGL